MINPSAPPSLRARFRLVHWWSLIFHRLFSVLPDYEIGCSPFELTRLVYEHPALKGRRAVHITDLHLDRYRARHDTILRGIEDLSPDWIFVTGDLLTMPEGFPHLFRFLSGLRALAPVYMTLGNHDHYSGIPVAQFAEWADRHKLHLLVNQVTFVPLHAGELAIVGLDDPSLHRADPRCIPPCSAGRFTIVLAHAPNVLDLLDHRHHVDLIVCGHSHGGQWRFSAVPSFWLPYGCNGREAGHYSHNGHRLYVNRGLGWSMFPARWNCPPEVVLIEWQ
jgi:predicted MPP superfamily phosphohydrolase